MGNYLLFQKSYAISPDLIFYSVEITFLFLSYTFKILNPIQTGLFLLRATGGGFTSPPL